MPFFFFFLIPLQVKSSPSGCRADVFVQAPTQLIFNIFSWHHLFRVNFKFFCFLFLSPFSTSLHAPALPTVSKIFASSTHCNKRRRWLDRGNSLGVCRGGYSAPQPATSDSFLLLMSYFADWRHIHLTCKTDLITGPAVCEPHIKQWAAVKSYDLSPHHRPSLTPPLPTPHSSTPETLIITRTLKGNYSETI